MSSRANNSGPPVVKTFGVVDHPDFREAVALLRATARCEARADESLEVAVVFQPRPGLISRCELELIQRRAPLAGIVAVVGSWCEGEIRTGRPWPGVRRFYWYEFPAWWRQQLALRLEGNCPEWSRPTTDLYRALPIRNLQSEIRNPQSGLVHLSTTHRETAGALADVLQRAGHAIVWSPSVRSTTFVRGAIAGIWDGGQLDEQEQRDLAIFARALSRDAAPVVALLDFPREDRGAIARKVGAAAILGKPWFNTDLITMINDIVARRAHGVAFVGRAA